MKGDTRAWRMATVVAAIGVLLAVTPTAAHSICGGTSPADVVFEGVAQPGPEVDGKLLSPATFIVERYIKGDGPHRVKVTTGISDGGEGLTAWVSTGLYPRAGERWEIRATRHAQDDVLTTSTCHKSQLLDAQAELIAAGNPERPNNRAVWAAVIVLSAIAATAAIRILVRHPAQTDLDSP